MPEPLLVPVDLSKWDGTRTQTIAKDAVSGSELQHWVKGQEAAKNRYIVFPTTEQMISWRRNVQDYLEHLYAKQ